MGKSEPHETREEVGEQEEKMVNPMRASRWPDVARRRAVRGGAMDGLDGVLGEEPTVHYQEIQGHGERENARRPE